MYQGLNRSPSHYQIHLVFKWDIYLPHEIFNNHVLCIPYGSKTPFKKCWVGTLMYRCHSDANQPILRHRSWLRLVHAMACFLAYQAITWTNDDFSSVTQWSPLTNILEIYATKSLSLTQQTFLWNYISISAFADVSYLMADVEAIFFV